MSEIFSTESLVVDNRLEEIASEVELILSKRADIEADLYGDCSNLEDDPYDPIAWSSLFEQTLAADCDELDDCAE